MVQKLLIDLLEAWCKANKIAPASADDLLVYMEQARSAEGDDWMEKASWLKAYIALWDESIDVMEMEDA